MKTMAYNILCVNASCSGLEGRIIASDGHWVKEPADPLRYDINVAHRWRNNLQSPHLVCGCRFDVIELDNKETL